MSLKKTTAAGFEPATARGVAMTKEVASWRTYMQQRRMNELRRSAHRLLHDDDASCEVMASIEKMIDEGRLQVRDHLQIWKDLGESDRSRACY